jgi:hypothetical protein
MELETDVYEDIVLVTNSTVRLDWNFGQHKWLPKVAWLSYINTEFQGSFDLKQTVGDGFDPDTVKGVTLALNYRLELRH